MEAIETLKGKGPEDITELAEKLSGIIVFLGCKAASPEEGYAMTKRALADGSGLKQLRRFIEAQGGNPDVTEDYRLFPQASVKDQLKGEID